MSDRLAQLLRHARRFGTEGIYEAAAEFPERERIRLRIELDAIERKQKRPGRPSTNRGHGKAARTREAVLLLASDGLVPKAIANKLQVSDRTVRRYLTARNGKGALPLKSAPQNRMAERSFWPKSRNEGNGSQ